jgi:hypothetical protein
MAAVLHLEPTRRSEDPTHSNLAGLSWNGGTFLSQRQKNNLFNSGEGEGKSLIVRHKKHRRSGFSILEGCRGYYLVTLSMNEKTTYTSPAQSSNVLSVLLPSVDVECQGPMIGLKPCNEGFNGPVLHGRGLKNSRQNMQKETGLATSRQILSQ